MVHVKSLPALWCQCYQTCFSLPQTKAQNKLECFSLTNFFHPANQAWAKLKVSATPLLAIEQSREIFSLSVQFSYHSSLNFSIQVENGWDYWSRTTKKLNNFFLFKYPLSKKYQVSFTTEKYHLIYHVIYEIGFCWKSKNRLKRDHMRNVVQAHLRQILKIFNLFIKQFLNENFKIYLIS